MICSDGYDESEIGVLLANIRRKNGTGVEVDDEAQTPPRPGIHRRDDSTNEIDDHSPIREMATPPGSGVCESMPTSSIIELKIENRRLYEENEALKGNISKFEEKMAELEHTLDLDSENKSHRSDTSSLPMNEHMIDVSAFATEFIVENRYIKVSDKKKHRAKSNAVEPLEETDDDIKSAMKALAKAASTQTKKHYRCKKEMSNAKKELLQLNTKMTKQLVEQASLRSTYLKTRTQLLEEQRKRQDAQDVAEQLSDELRELEALREDDSYRKQSILEQIEASISPTKSYPGILEVSSDDADAITRSISKESTDSNAGTPTAKITLELEILDLKSHVRKQMVTISKLEAKLALCKTYFTDD